ncbi:hypothetical protein UW163_08375 [Ralstonia solanacearum]|nr:hypothetical protein UW163_08375 [Ralstonia solanacearum]AMP73602.1 hypothetical protein RALBFv3_05240 [Ralstonia solanacearum]OAI74131.1 hypothetical protein RSP797_03920 [Ralstonia solanacearum]
MARDRDRQHVGRAGAGHGAYRAGPADAFGDFGVRDGRAGRDVAQRPPDRALERCAAHVERIVEAERRRVG